MSELQELLSRRLLPNNPVDAAQHRITVRLNYDLHEKLVKLAAVFGMSKTATCEDIAAAAIKDAWTHYVNTLDEHELMELHQEMDEEHTAHQYELFQAEQQEETNARFAARVLNNGAPTTFEGEVLK